MVDMTTDIQSKTIAAAGWISLFGNLLLTLIKLIAGIRTGSLAVTGDGIDSSTDVIIAIVTLVISAVIARPSDWGHPWGHGRAETTATLALSFIIVFAGAQLGIQAAGAVIGALSGGDALLPIDNTASPALLAVTAVSICGKLLLAYSQYRLGKRAASAMILANAQNMRNDVVISVSVLAGLALVKLFSLPILDPIIAIPVSLWIIRNGLRIFFETNTELMDGGANAALYKTLFDTIKTVPGVSNPHRARIRKIASRWDIDLDIEVEGSLSVYEAHKIAVNVEKALHKAIPDIYDIMVHVEPSGGKVETGEQYGLSEADVKAPPK
jgi:cation diffusion facilitator family transporter